MHWFDIAPTFAGNHIHPDTASHTKNVYILNRIGLTTRITAKHDFVWIIGKPKERQGTENIFIMFELIFFLFQTKLLWLADLPNEHSAKVRVCVSESVKGIYEWRAQQLNCWCQLLEKPWNAFASNVKYKNGRSPFK